MLRSWSSRLGFTARGGMRKKGRQKKPREGRRKGASPLFFGGVGRDQKRRGNRRVAPATTPLRINIAHCIALGPSTACQNPPLPVPVSLPAPFCVRRPRSARERPKPTPCRNTGLPTDRRAPNSSSPHVVGPLSKGTQNSALARLAIAPAPPSPAKDRPGLRLAASTSFGRKVACTVARELGVALPGWDPHRHLSRNVLPRSHPAMERRRSSRPGLPAHSAYTPVHNNNAR